MQPTYSLTQSLNLTGPVNYRAGKHISIPYIARDRRQIASSDWLYLTGDKNSNLEH